MKLKQLGFLVVLFVWMLSGSSAWSQEPSTEYTPKEVITIVVQALKSNRRELDDGLEIVFRFASPNNKRNTGPIERFKRMIKLGFGDMVNHKATRFGDILIDDNVALQKVWFLSRSGTEHGYLFRLGKQTTGEFSGMWMTDAVYPLNNDRPKGQSI